MKKFFLIVTFFITVCAYSQNAEPDDILHKWEMQSKEGRISFKKDGDTYIGISIYGKRLLEADGKTYKKDVNNPDPALRNRRLDNYVLISGLVFKDGKWTDGKIYNYEDGNSYDVSITINGNVLSMRAYKGVPILGKTIKWNKIE